MKIKLSHIFPRCYIEACTVFNYFPDGWPTNCKIKKLLKQSEFITNIINEEKKFPYRQKTTEVINQICDTFKIGIRETRRSKRMIETVACYGEEYPNSVEIFSSEQAVYLVVSQFYNPWGMLANGKKLCRLDEMLTFLGKKVNTIEPCPIITRDFTQCERIYDLSITIYEKHYKNMHEHVYKKVRTSQHHIGKETLVINLHRLG